MSCPRHELAPGYSISRIINGGWQLSAGHSSAAIDREATIDALLQLRDGGLTTFDCADIYTGVEELFGAFLRCYRERGDDPALDGVQIHTKCVPDLDDLPHLTRRHIEAIVDRSLMRLGVERLDLVQFHWWDYQIPGAVDAAGWLADLQRAGKIRLLGVTNFDAPRLRQIVDAGIGLATVQVQYSVLDQRPKSGMIDVCVDHGIELLCYGALAGGFLTEKFFDVPEPLELTNRSLIKYRLIIEEVGGWTAYQNLLVVLAEVAAKHRVSIANVAVRWVLDRAQVAGVMVGIRNAEHLGDNLRALSLQFDAEDEGILSTVLAELNQLAGDPFDLERIPFGQHRQIMKTGLNSEG